MGIGNRIKRFEVEYELVWCLLSFIDFGEVDWIIW